MNEWDKYSTISTGSQPGPEVSIMTRYFYDQFKNLCPKQVLDPVWKAWLRLGAFWHGQSQRFLQYCVMRTMKEWYEFYQDL